MPARVTYGGREVSRLHSPRDGARVDLVYRDLDGVELGRLSGFTVALFSKYGRAFPRTGCAMIGWMDDEATKEAPLAQSLLLPPGEWQVFYLISSRGPLTIRELVNEMTSDRREADRRYSTMLTLAQRLVRRGYLAMTPPAGAARGRASAVTYSATVPYEDALRRQTERFLSQYILDRPDDILRFREIVDRHLEKLSHPAAPCGR